METKGAPSSSYRSVVYHVALKRSLCSICVSKIILWDGPYERRLEKEGRLQRRDSIFLNREIGRRGQKSQFFAFP